MAEEFNNKLTTVGKFINDNPDIYACLNNRFADKLILMIDLIHAWSIHPTLAAKFSRSINRYKSDEHWSNNSMFANINDTVIALVNQRQANEVFNKQLDANIELLQKEYDNATQFKTRIGEKLETAKRTRLNRKNIICARIVDLNVYLVSDYDSINDFLHNLHNIHKDLKIEQIILNEQLQELVIIIRNQYNDITRITQLIEKYLSHPVKIKHNKPLELVVNDIYATREELQMIFDSMCTTLISRDLIPKYHDMILAPVFEAEANGIVKYAKYDMQVIEDRLIDFYSVKNKQIVNNNIVNNINNTIIINNYAEVKKPPTTSDIATIWTVNNPPHDKESITNYYTRYKNDNPQGISNISFGRLMAKSKDYKQQHSGSTYFWTRA